jgi:hypothetical protein
MMGIEGDNSEGNNSSFLRVQPFFYGKGNIRALFKFSSLKPSFLK